MLNTLEASCVLKRSAVQDGIQLVKARRNECLCDRGRHAIIKRWTNLPEGTNVIETGAG